VRLSRFDLRDHINCRKNDRWPSYQFYRALQRPKSSIRYICEIFGVPRFSSFQHNRHLSDISRCPTWGFGGITEVEFRARLETRIAPRHRVSKAGTIEFVGGAINCVVRNLSLTGAAIEVSDPPGIPESFILVMTDDGLRLLCHIVWRTQYRIGVAFD
jgi:hypothetical protein